jgi:hypothetical protein
MACKVLKIESKFVQSYYLGTFEILEKSIIHEFGVSAQ